ncbi:hypothetical protein EMIHUDRAFT_239912 [Emiliania huxleyi CCMP1516]|uniref:Uncharacterized protein n=2 Tax=Emiliania huxleyi TaxID=2903 RepID=A0A0D3JGK3_EMIH1|nr:hypothetical protein EMIHUDRAFT_240067 [Emiliania huxleyi CCMP1516]XP_005775707.1 hypothetical protein EMIHUDRAFT_239912 [Emiliania huxleyi CCMP1516]EOD22638.1 hypothetical protein EMIHUDRAFT_240067 [Emiliania huxleyi CCMP1516]EOD23278.1 hypothetical protein EMIHUDRAFT_239912 [Emiliania huxleyi CCMP1516]|eukprot:XP_005775067.1 hypothetical protein EMIHUDRAFT_240067 [Emiliania huxleyi CCMP1516]
MWVLPVLAFQPAPRASCAAVASVPLPFRGGVVLARSLPLEVEEVVAAAFRKQYPPAKIAALWTELKACFGSEELALQAVRENPQIINPSYTDPPKLLARSKSCLVEIMSEEEAIEVMLKNPAVLQCGLSLRSTQADEIKSFANLRYYGGRLVPNPTAALAVVVAALFYVVAGSYVGDVAALDTIKPVLGFVGAGLFGATLYGVASSSRRKS